MPYLATFIFGAFIGAFAGVFIMVLLVTDGEYLDGDILYDDFDEVYKPDRNEY